ncbi:MAG: triple tyrosine motif-containing protein, partial [Bacteroidia bacterium]|nr:triple tyrosine motif-containing protein [Bacteroidia bacterium]
MQDSKGYMWYGTNNGLSRYDGYVFKSYKSNYLNPYFFSNNKIISIAEDKSNCLWIGTALGLNQIDLSTGKLSHFENKLIMGITISSIVIASDNTPYFGTSNGLFYFDRKLNDFVQILKDTKGRRFLSTYITRLFIDDQNYLWIGAWETGCDVYNLNTKLFSEYSYLKKKELLIINNFFEDSNHNLWMSTWDKSGVYRIENPHQPSQSKITIFYPQKNEESTRQPVVYAINQNNTNGNILFATSNGLQTLLNIFKYENRVQLTNANSTKISNNEIYTIYKDRTGLIWYSNYGFGINAISSNRDNFEQYNLATLLGNTNLSSSITSVYESENGLLWLGVKSMVLSLFDRKSKTLTSYKDHPVLKDISNKANSILSFFKPSTLNELWLGTRYEGLYAVKLVQGKISTLEKKAITGVDPKNHGIKYMVEDQQNNIWLATTKGLIKAHQNKTGNYVFQLENGYKNRFLNQIINTLLIDNEQNLWVGTENIGLYKLTFSKNKIFIEEYSINNHKINNNEVICMLQDYKNRIWIGTKGGGLSLYNPENKKFEIVKNMSLIPDDAIYSIAEDNWGNIWLATGNGLVSYNEDLPIDQKIRFFSGKEGVKINSYNPNSVYKNNNNELFFGGNNGFMAFVPEKNVEKSFSPRPVITGFYVANEPLEDLEPTVKNKISKYDVSYADQLILDYNQKNIIIEFSALLYQNISATKYAYKLEGLDKDWVYVDSKKRFVNYNNLSKGNYRFHIKACNSLGAWCDQPTILYIKIKPAPWDTFFAYILYLFILFSIGFVVIRFIFNRMKLRKMFAIEQIEREKSEEVHQAKLKFFTNISHEFFTPITILS